MSYKIIFSDVASRDIEIFKKSGDLNSLKKLHQILEELRDHPETGIGTPE